MKYIKELDAVRGIAILSVVADHWFPETSWVFKGAEVLNAPNLFFTISGFLITRILLSAREEAAQQGYGRLVVFKNFFFKRMLRIFPPYYLLLLIIFLINKSEPIRYAPYVSFTANFYIYGQQAWGQITHLWSMAVEEQFYFIWPWLLLFMPKKGLPYAISIFALMGIVSQRLLPDNEFSPILTVSCFDALALGALLAWAVTYCLHRLPQVYTILSIAAAASLVLFIKNQITDRFYILSNRTLTAVMVLWVLAYFVTKQRPAHKRSFIFRNKPLMTLGRMSYGIYLYHAPLPFYAYKLYALVYNRFPLLAPLQHNRYVYIAENFCLLLLISWLSWRFFETPLLNLKKHLTTPKRLPPVATTAAPVEPQAANDPPWLIVPASNDRPA